MDVSLSDKRALRAAYRGLLCAFYDFDQAPALVSAERSSFHDAYFVSDIAGVFFVVHHEFFGALNELAVQRVHEAALYQYRDGLIHLGRHHNAYFLFAELSNGSFHVRSECDVIKSRRMILTLTAPASDEFGAHGQFVGRHGC